MTALETKPASVMAEVGLNIPTRTFMLEILSRACAKALGHIAGPIWALNTVESIKEASVMGVEL